MTELQNYIDGYGFGIIVKELASRAYSHMAAKGHKVCIVNDRYLEVDGTTYLFSKSRKHGRWIAVPAIMIIYNRCQSTITVFRH